MYRETAEKLLEFIKKSPTAFQAVETMKTRFSEEGFTELREEDHWKIKAGGNYFVTRNNSALIAFSIPEEGGDSFRIMASHSDSPALRSRKIRR